MNIELVPTTPDYAELWHEWRAEPNTIRFNPLAQSSVEELRERMARMSSDLSDLEAAEMYQFFFRYQSDLVGSATLKDINHKMAYGEIGYEVVGKHQGKGIGAQAVGQFVSKIFSETKLRRIIAYVAEDNIASCRLLQKLGFVREGVLREHYIINGKPTNEILFALMRSDWERNHQSETTLVVKQPRLQTDRLVLEPYRESDLADILAYASHPDVSKFVPWDSHKSLDDSKNFLNFVAQSTNNSRGRLFFVFAIRLKETGCVIGSIDFKNANPRCGQIDYALGYKYWNKGIVTEAAEAIKRWAFESLPEMARFQAFCASENIGSARVMEKIGMQKEGIRRKAFVLKGQPVNITDYALIRE